jgi:NTE family protein
MNLMLEQLGTDNLKPPIATLRPLHTLVILPREDLRSVAARYAHELPLPLRLLLKGLGAMNRDGMQLVSYLLFESGFTRALIEMGYNDAMGVEEDLRAFLFDQPMDTLDAPVHIKVDLER